MYKLTQLPNFVQLEQCKSEQLRQQKSPIDHEATSCVQKTSRRIGIQCTKPKAHAK